jgi:hypothetical protein
VLLSFVPIDPPRPLADYYFSVKFSADAGSVPLGGAQRFELAFNKESFDLHDQSDDYSYDASKTNYSVHDEVCLYRNGVLIWGIEPEVD